ncbi:hypothetical protein KCP77_10895 [Salmonella enterica subsp. enterica]|nr:hypothetical protein KCP77_10895 [Salmonella enterica subsp. enterica]
MLDVSNTNSETVCKGIGVIQPHIGGSRFSERLIPTNVNLGISGRSVPDGSPLTFGYEVEDIHGHNIIGSVVGGEASSLFTFFNEVPPGNKMWRLINNKGLSCSITFSKAIDESKSLYLSVRCHEIFIDGCL